MRIAPSDTEEYDETAQVGVADAMVSKQAIAAVRQHIKDLEMEIRVARGA